MFKKGYIPTKEHREKLSLSKKGANNYNFGKVGYWKGKKRSLESVQKMSLTLKRKGIKPPSHKGVKDSIETKIKKSIAHLGKKKSILFRKNMSGENHHSWKGGITPLLLQIRNCFNYRQWRSDCFTRDDYTCQICSMKGGKLNVDHIKAFSLIIEENNIKSLEDALTCNELWNINNGRTLCVPCHRKTDTWGGRKKKIIN